MQGYRRRCASRLSRQLVEPDTVHTPCVSPACQWNVDPDSMLIGLWTALKCSGRAQLIQKRPSCPQSGGADCSVFVAAAAGAGGGRLGPAPYVAASTGAFPCRRPGRQHVRCLLRGTGLQVGGIAPLRVKGRRALRRRGVDEERENMRQSAVLCVPRAAFGE